MVIKIHCNLYKCAYNMHGLCTCHELNMEYDVDGEVICKSRVYLEEVGV